MNRGEIEKSALRKAFEQLQESAQQQQQQPTLRSFMDPV